MIIKRIVFFTALLGASMPALPCAAGLKVYYLRHAQSGGNVARDWAEIPADKRPAYVGHRASFSPLGEQQAAFVSAKLAGHSFDFIAVSPLWRTHHTILGLLQERNAVAEIWPELIEFGAQNGDQSLIATANLPAPSPEVLSGGPAILLSEKEKPHFRFRPDGLTEPKIDRPGAEGAADLTFILNRVITRVRTEFGGTEKSILLVGHGTAGRYFLQLLTGDEETTKLPFQNIGLWMAEQQPDGSFKLVLANDKPVASR